MVGPFVLQELSTRPVLAPWPHARFGRVPAAREPPKLVAMNGDDDNSPVGFMGRVRNMKVLTWVLIVGLGALTVGASTVLFVTQFANANK